MYYLILLTKNLLDSQENQLKLSYEAGKQKGKPSKWLLQLAPSLWGFYLST